MITPQTFLLLSLSMVHQEIQLFLTARIDLKSSGTKGLQR